MSNAIGTFRGPWGVRVDIDQSLIFLVGFLLFLSMDGAILDGIAIVVILIGSIYLHELGHAWGCLIQKIPVRRVVLHGGGGLCERAGSATARQTELIVLMGPLTNLALWAISGILYWLFLSIPLWLEFFPSDLWFRVSFWIYLAGIINLALFVFNLIPVQPLDGGKLLHLALLRLLSPGAAHRVTGGIGLVFSILWFPAAIWLYLTFGFILFFFPNPKAHWRMMRGDLAF